MQTPRPYAHALSVDDFAKLDDNDGELLELVRGRVVREPQPVARHGIVCVTISAELTLYCRRTGAGRVLGNDTGFVLSRNPGTVRGPDVAFLSQERCAEVENWGAWIEGPPDLAVEVLSPSNRKSQLQEKVADYQRAGTHVIWLIDPASQSITVYEREALRTLTSEDRLTCPEWLPGFSVLVADVFR